MKSYLHEIRNIDLFWTSRVFDVLGTVDQIFAGRVREDGGAAFDVFHISEYHVWRLDHFLLIRTKKEYITSRNSITNIAKNNTQ